MSGDADFMFAMLEEEIHETSSYSTSHTLEEDNESFAFEIEDDMCSP